MITLSDQIQCLKREIAYRNKVFPKLIPTQMTQELADYEIAAMTAALETLVSVWYKKANEIMESPVIKQGSAD